LYNSLKNRAVLYVGDELDMSTFVSNFFDTVHKVANISEAFDIYYTHYIDILIVDIEISHMDGLKFIEEIRENGDSISIIATSSYPKIDYFISLVELGLMKYIVKPLTVKKLEEMLGKLKKHFDCYTVTKISKNIIIDSQKMIIKHNNTGQILTEREFNFLMTIIKNEIVRYNDLEILWGEKVPTANAIRSFVAKLRKKLPYLHIKNKSGMGYYIDTKNIK